MTDPTTYIWATMCEPLAIREDAPELKPCPFCGADEVNLSVREDEDGGSYIYCHVCDSVYYNDNESQDIIDMWNRRVKE